MRSEETEFIGGPLDGQVLAVLVGITGNPPRTYSVPVPGTTSDEPTVYVYHRMLNPDQRRRPVARWRYEYDPVGQFDHRPPHLRWPWQRGTGQPSG